MLIFVAVVVGIFWPCSLVGLVLSLNRLRNMGQEKKVAGTVIERNLIYKPTRCRDEELQDEPYIQLKIEYPADEKVQTLSREFHADGNGDYAKLKQLGVGDATTIFIDRSLRGGADVFRSDERRSYQICLLTFIALSPVVVLISYVCFFLDYRVQERDWVQLCLIAGILLLFPEWSAVRSACSNLSGNAYEAVSATVISLDAQHYSKQEKRGSMSLCVEFERFDTVRRHTFSIQEAQAFSGNTARFHPGDSITIYIHKEKRWDVRLAPLGTLGLKFSDLFWFMVSIAFQIGSVAMGLSTYGLWRPS